MGWFLILFYQFKAVAFSSTALNWLNRIKNLHDELVRIKEEQEKLAQEESSFADEAQRLKAAQQALVLEGDYAQLVAIRKQQNEEGTALTVLQHKLPDQEGLLSQAEERLNTTKAQLDQSRLTREQGHALIKQVRELDLRIRGKDQAIIKEQAISHDLQQKNAAAQQQDEQLEQNLTLAQTRQKQSRTYLETHQVDEQLISDLAAIRKTLDRLKEVADRQAALGPALEKAEQLTVQAGQSWQEKVQAGSAAEKELATIRQLRQEIQQKAEAQLDGRRLEELRRDQILLAEQRNTLGHLLEIHQKKDTIEQELTTHHTRQAELAATNKKQEEQLNLLRQQRDQARQDVDIRRTLVEQANRIRDLEEERTHLQDKTACPLCGALDHPYAQGNIPPLNQYEQDLQTALAAEKQAEQDLNTAEIQAARLVQDARNLGERIKEKQGAVQEAEERITEQCSKFAVLAPGPENDLREERPTALTTRLSRLEKGLASIQQQLEALDQLDRKLARISKALEEQQAKANKAGQEQERAAHVKEQAENDRQRLIKEQQTTNNELEEIRFQALEELSVYGINELRLPALPQLLTDLT
ncbi:MAG: hypothetical protein D3917_17910, partial [Candidatus Electrothrix sp. AX5]|nr:hypothetical protein [Candidatus Electrothrix sp. AX5]